MRRKWRIGSRTAVRACSHRRLSTTRMDRSGRSAAVSCRASLETASLLLKIPLTSLRALAAPSLSGVRISSLYRIAMSQTPGSPGAATLTTSACRSGVLMNSGGVVTRYSRRISAAFAAGDSSLPSLPTSSMDKTPPPHRSGRSTCRAKYLVGCSS